MQLEKILVSLGGYWGLAKVKRCSQQPNLVLPLILKRIYFTQSSDERGVEGPARLLSQQLVGDRKDPLPLVWTEQNEIHVRKILPCAPGHLAS